jgi:nucleotidyltransferase AbiEii toxin of type IV toxin-antitoxin system
LATDLTQAAVPFALVGGLAVSTRAEPRLTRDADVAVSVPDDGGAETVIHQLVAKGYHPAALLEQEAGGRLATVRLVHRDRPDVVVDLLFASSGIEPEIVDLAEDLEVLPDLVIPVATVGHLLAMKLLARDDRRRPADADDLRGLAAVATSEDWSLARSAIQLITKRGFDRGVDLEGGLESLLAERR